MTREKDKRHRRNLENLQEFQNNDADDLEEADGGPIGRLVTEIRDRGHSGRFTLTTAECHDRISKVFEEEHYARSLEKLKSDTDASK